MKNQFDHLFPPLEQKTPSELTDDEWYARQRREITRAEWLDHRNRFPGNPKNVSDIELTSKQLATIEQVVGAVVSQGWGVVVVSTTGSILELRQFTMVLTYRLHRALQRSLFAVPARDFIDCKHLATGKTLLFLHGISTATSEGMKRVITDEILGRIRSGCWTVVEAGDTLTDEEVKWPEAFATLALPESMSIVLGGKDASKAID